ncbi:MAG TPA: copper resistance protein CopC [Actinomycetes bacterium]|nr:copper resistance protein CopC [Actinomycetes bacterium]
MRVPIGGLRHGRRLGRPAVAAALAGLWLVASGPSAGAHALLRESDPAGGASLDRPPRQVVLTFTERPEQGLSSIRVFDTGGRQVGRGDPAPVAGAPLRLALALGDLPDGTYTVSWRVVSKDDGHVTVGSFAFGVGVPAPAATEATRAAPEGASPSPSPLATAARLALYGGLMLLVGAAVTGLAVFDRVLPEGARTLLVAGALLAVAGGAARFLAERARIDAPLGTLLASSTGQGLLRLTAGVLATAVATWLLVAATGRPAGPEHDPAAEGDGGLAEGDGGLAERDATPADAWRLALVGAAAGITMLLHVLAGHAAGPSPLRAVNLFVQWLHVLAVGAWVGGLVWLLAGLRGRERPERVAAVVRFSRLAAPVLGLVAVTGLSRALHLAGGWQGLLDTSYGRYLDLKVALFGGLVALGALNRYQVVRALVAGVDRIGDLRRNVRGEVVLAACVLAVTAVLSQLPPGEFVVGRAAAKPPPPAGVQVEGSDFATSVRLALTVSPGRAGPNSFAAKVTDYDSGEDWPATRVVLRFTSRDRPDIGGATLDLAKAGDGLWRGQGSELSIEGQWVVVGLVEGSGPAVTVPLELETRPAAQRVQVSEVPGQPTLYTITLAAGGTLQTYLDPGRPGPNTVHFTFFDPAGDEQPTTKARARMTKPSSVPEPLTLLRLGPGHFAANVDLEPGRVSFAIDATAGRRAVGGRFEQVIE